MSRGGPLEENSALTLRCLSYHQALELLVL